MPVTKKLERQIATAVLASDAFEDYDLDDVAELVDVLGPVLAPMLNGHGPISSPTDESLWLGFIDYKNVDNDFLADFGATPGAEVIVKLNSRISNEALHRFRSRFGNAARKYGNSATTRHQGNWFYAKTLS